MPGMLGTHLIPVIESSDMRGARVRVIPVTSGRAGALQKCSTSYGTADRGGHGRPLGDPVLGAGAIVRIAYAVLIALAVAVLLFHEFTTRFAPGHAPDGDHDVGSHPEDLLWAIPAIAIGGAIGTVLVVASGSHDGLARLARIGVPWLGRHARARANGIAWAAVGVLGVHFTGEAFDVVPGGHPVAAAVIGAVLGFGMFRLHRHSIRHEAYRTFNLIAMLLAVGSVASMGITSTGSWWTHNFSTLGTSDDLAAACFNVAIVVSGAGMAGMSGGLTRAVAEARIGARRGGVATMRALIVIIGVSLMGVGLVPIDGATDLHNAAASAAAGAFAVLCLGVQLWARRLPTSLVVASYASIAIEAIAMIAYDGIGVFNLTVFEVVAFTLVFAWLIALVAMTHGSHEADAARRPHLVRRRSRRRVLAIAHDAVPRRLRDDRRPPPGRNATRRPPRARRSRTPGDMQRALRRGDDRADDPPDAVRVA